MPTTHKKSHWKALPRQKGEQRIIHFYNEKLTIERPCKNISSQNRHIGLCNKS